MLAATAVLQPDSIRTLVSIVGICISASISIVLWVLARRRKRLSYQTLATRLLGMRHQELAGHVQIMVDGEPVRDVGLVLVTVKNSGNQSIRKEDFEEPIRLSLSGITRIVSVDVYSRSPADLPVRIRLLPKPEGEAHTDLEISPLLLNGGDWMTIKLLIANFEEGELAVYGRILGVSQIQERGYRPFKWKYIFALLVNLLGVSTLEISSHPTRPWTVMVAASLGIVPFFFCCPISLS